MAGDAGLGRDDAGFTKAQLREMDGRGTKKIDRAYGSELHKRQIESMQSAEARMSPAQLRVEAQVAQQMSAAQLHAMADGMKGMTPPKLAAMSAEEAHLSVAQLKGLLVAEARLAPAQLGALGQQLGRMPMKNLRQEAATKEKMSAAQLTRFVREEEALTPHALATMDGAGVASLEAEARGEGRGAHFGQTAGAARAAPRPEEWRTPKSKWMHWTPHFASSHPPPSSSASSSSSSAVVPRSAVRSPSHMRGHAAGGATAGGSQLAFAVLAAAALSLVAAWAWCNSTKGDGTKGGVVHDEEEGIGLRQRA